MSKLSIDKDLLEEVSEELHDHWFDYDDEGESYNNDEIIALSKRLDKAMEEASSGQT